MIVPIVLPQWVNGAVRVTATAPTSEHSTSIYTHVIYSTVTTHTHVILLVIYTHMSYISLKLKYRMHVQDPFCKFSHIYSYIHVMPYRTVKTLANTLTICQATNTLTQTSASAIHHEQYLQYGALLCCLCYSLRQNQM